MNDKHPIFILRTKLLIFPQISSWGFLNSTNGKSILSLLKHKTLDSSDSSGSLTLHTWYISNVLKNSQTDPFTTQGRSWHSFTPNCQWHPMLLKCKTMFSSNGLQDKVFYYWKPYLLFIHYSLLFSLLTTKLSL